MEEAYTYYIDNMKYNKNDEFREMEYRKSRDRWEKLLKSYQGIKGMNPTFKNLPLGEAKEIVLENMLKIIGESYKDKLKFILSKVKERKGEDLYCTVEWNIIEDKPKLEYLHITGKATSKSIWLMGHECTHALLLPYETIKFNKVFGNIHYHELPNMFIESLLALQISEIIKEEDYVEKTESLRIQDTRDWALTFDNLSIKEIEIAEYFTKHQQITYILSNVYANRLIELYKDSQKIVLEKYREFLKGELCLIDLLSYFNITLKDNDTYFSYQKKLQFWKEK